MREEVALINYTHQSVRDVGRNNQYFLCQYCETQKYTMCQNALFVNVRYYLHKVPAGFKEVNPSSTEIFVEKNCIKNAAAFGATFVLLIYMKFQIFQYVLVNVSNIKF